MKRKKRQNFDLLPLLAGAFLVTALLFHVNLFGSFTTPARSREKVAISEAKKEEPKALDKLKEVYEKQKNISMKNITPRFSVFEDSILGFKIAYPVGFIASSQSFGVKITPEVGGGEIDVYVSKGSFDIKVNTNGADKKQSEVLGNAGDFVRDSFQFVQATKYDKKALDERFSQGNTNVPRY